MSEPKIRSADNLIVQEEASRLGRPIQEAKKEEEVKLQNEPELEPEKSENEPEDEEQESGSEEELESKEEGEKETLDDTSKNNESTDEYGTKVTKKKFYTEEEVQRMIRERLARVKNPQQTQDVQEATKNFTPDPNSEDTWEAQLEGFIEQTISKREQKAKEAEWREESERNHAEFEMKFTQSMGKYKDFEQTVSGKPISNAMMEATRDMNDPAAFIYAACKQHPKELERIAQIKNPISQGVEMGRLEERMKKARSIPSSPKPAKQISGDASSALPQPDIDARISQHAKSKIMERRK